MKKLSADRLREVLHYCPDTGVFTWATKTNKRIVVGAEAGTLTNHGYVALKIDGERFLAHRLAFFYVTGEWPSEEIDHINGTRTDNRWANLRPCTSAENRQNQRRAHPGSSSGFLGVSWNARLEKWVAQIAIQGKRKYLGLFATEDEAQAAYVQAKREVHPFGVL